MPSNESSQRPSLTLTVRLSADVGDRLGGLATRTNRTSAALAGDAITEFVAREGEIVAAIERGLDDVRAGRVVPHDEAMERLRRTVERAKPHR